MTADATPMTPRRRLAAGTRMLVGLILAAALAAGVLLGISAALPGAQTTPARTVVTPEGSDTVLACSGPFRALGRDASDALQMQSAGTTEVIVGSEGTEPIPSEISVQGLEGESTAEVYTLAAVDGTPPAVGVAESIRLGEEDLAGFAAAACRPPSMQAWLVGGAGAVGTSDVLTLSNPGEVASSVTVTTFDDGVPTDRTLVVPSLTQIALPLAASAIGAAAPVVHVSAEGAPVRAVLQSSLTRTLDPSGIDLQDDAGMPATELLLAGVQVTQRSEESVTSVRLMAPEGEGEALLSIRASESAGDLVEPQTVPLEAGVPIEVGFPGLAPGTYSVHVQATVPVVAAAWQSTGSHAGSDFAWMTPAPVIDGPIVASVPAGIPAQLHLVGAGDGDRTVLLTELPSGTTRELTVSASGSTLVTLRNGAGYLIEPEGGIHAAIAMSGTDALAGWPLWPAPEQATPITVFP